MENQIPSALCFTHAQRYVKAKPKAIKKIVILLGSPRKTGTSKTEILTTAVADGFRNAGAEVETIYLRDKEIHPCQGCFSCWTKTPGKCIFNDDVAGIMKKSDEADLLVFAAPLYHFGIPALMKAYIERTLPMIQPFLITREDGKTTHPVRQGYRYRQYVLIIGVCGFPEVAHFGAFSANFHYIANAGGSFGYNIVAEIYRPLAETLNNPFYQAENDRVLDLAKTAGHDLVANGAIEEGIINAIADVRLNQQEVFDAANKAWELCIKEGITMPQFQAKLSGQDPL